MIKIIDSSVCVYLIEEHATCAIICNNIQNQYVRFYRNTNTFR